MLRVKQLAKVLSIKESTAYSVIRKLKHKHDLDYEEASISEDIVSKEYGMSIDTIFVLKEKASVYSKDKEKSA